MSGNPWLPEPESPNPLTSWDVCAGCGASYATFRPGITFQDGANYIRYHAAAQGDQGNGFRSRRPVLWAMHVLKMQEWYQEHYRCEDPRK